MLRGKNILIGITGAIAAYKICELIRMFKRQNADVKVVLTPNAIEFVTLKTIETLSGNEVYLKQFKKKDPTKHISLADWADVFVVAPLSANTLSKFANGIADNLLTSIFCASYGKELPILLSPSMNDGMWDNEFVQENIKKLSKNCKIIAPDYGFLACNAIGKGRLPSVEDLFEATISLLEKHKPLLGKKILITAGGTKEAIDPVRYIGNSSSGKMGISLANSAHEMGAAVKLISTFEHKAPFEVCQVTSALNMEDAIKKDFNNFDVLIMAAAVADYRPREVKKSKINTRENETLTIELVKNPDILKNIAPLKKENQKVIGFCLSTENLEENAKRKLEEKKCDYIVANKADDALGRDDTKIVVYSAKGQEFATDTISKQDAARKILELLIW